MAKPTPPMTQGDVVALQQACAAPLPPSPTGASFIVPKASVAPKGYVNENSVFAAAENINAPLHDLGPRSTAAPAFGGGSDKKKRSSHKHSTNFPIFIDSDATPHESSLKLASKEQKYMKNGRIVLAEISGNSSPLPNYRSADEGEGFNPNDPDYEDTENFGCRPHPGPRPTTTPSSSSPPSAGHPRPQGSRSQASRMNAAPASVPLSRPANMLLYNLLELKNWKASDDEVRAAYKRNAMIFHPDRVKPEDKEVATICMQEINVARDVLLDARRREAYDRTGEVV